MLRRILDWQLSLFDKGKPLYRLRPLVSAVDSFCYEPAITTKGAPHIRDAVDAKRWMVIVVIALLPCILMAIWNTGLQKMVYASGDLPLMQSYLSASTSLGGYFNFCFSDGRWATILGLGLGAFLPVVLITYVVGGACEALFAIVRRHEIAEGFLVTGILYALILPPTIPYWMVAVGIAFGVIVGKEFFGGTGMNILNPALTARVFLFFAFPQKMTGNVWVGTNPTKINQSLNAINTQADLPSYDAFTEATPLAKFNVGFDIKRSQIDAILSGQDPIGLAPENLDAAHQFAHLETSSNWDLFFGNRLGSMGETSILFVLIGALYLIWTGVGAWRTMVAVGLGAYITALLFNFGAAMVGPSAPAIFTFPAYRHFLVGSLAFGLVFMATEPVSSPYATKAKWVYGFLIGALVILIRTINPAYPEGVMLAILFGNVFAPLIDHFAIRRYRRGR